MRRYMPENRDQDINLKGKRWLVRDRCIKALAEDLGQQGQATLIPLKLMYQTHLDEELQRSSERIVINTRYGPIIGGRVLNKAAVFLEVPYAIYHGRFMHSSPLPSHFRYDIKEFVTESKYAVQPMNDGQARDIDFVDKVGHGNPSEDPLFLNIVSPPSFPLQGGFPVKVYIHGGFLQFGSPHDLDSQAQFVSAERSEVWVNIGYRLSAFGFLACDQPRLDGNYGFKDQWNALLWIKDNIADFGGNTDDIQLTGLSAGAHSVHQILHHASVLPPGVKAPFHSAVLQSNAMVTNPKTGAELRPQYQALCRALDLCPDSPDILSTLRDPFRVPSSLITHIIESEALAAEYGTFRGCWDGDWISSAPDPMTWQRTGGLARGLREKGVRSVIVGDLSEEWYLYSIAHPLQSPSDILPNLARYYPNDVVERLVGMHRRLAENAGEEEVERLFGEILSNGQVHLPVRLLARDLHTAGFPVLRYEIRWAPGEAGSQGYVTHGTDRPLWTFSKLNLLPDEAVVAQAWLDRISNEVKTLEKEGKPCRDATEVLTLDEQRNIGWKEDGRWAELSKLAGILPGELVEPVGTL